MRIYKTIAAFTLSFFLLNSCSEIFCDDVEGLDEHFFELDLKIENQEKLYHIGDTIWITHEAPSQLVDKKLNKLETINNATFIFPNS